MFLLLGFVVVVYIVFDCCLYSQSNSCIQIVKDGTRRPIGGTLGVRIRLKTPLVKKDVRYYLLLLRIIYSIFFHFLLCLFNSILNINSSNSIVALLIHITG